MIKSRYVWFKQNECCSQNQLILIDNNNPFLPDQKMIWSSQQKWMSSVQWGKCPWWSSTLTAALNMTAGLTFLRAERAAVAPRCHPVSPLWVPQSTSRTQQDPCNQKRMPREKNWPGTSWVRTGPWWIFWTRVAGWPPWTWWKGSFQWKTSYLRGCSSAGGPLWAPDSPPHPQGVWTGEIKLTLTVASWFIDL